MNTVRRLGNFAIADTRHGLLSFSAGSTFGQGEYPVSTFNFSQPQNWNDQYLTVGDYNIIPIGNNNDLPLELMRILDDNYAGEGILGRIQGLQWGDGPRLYEEVEQEDGTLKRMWRNDAEIMDWLDSFDGVNQLLHCHTDLVHGLGYFVKLYRNRGARIGRDPRISSVEHVPVSRARLEWPGLDRDYPTRIITGSFPYPQLNRLAAYPIWNRQIPFQFPVTMRYQSVYSFCKSFYSTPRYMGALIWMKLSNSIAPLLIQYNKNASAISYHIESPQEYWDDARDALKNKCVAEGVKFTEKMFDDFKDQAFQDFTDVLTGTENVGKFLHTQEFFNTIANKFQGWKVTPIDKKIKEYVDAQIAIANKGDSAATSGFGLNPALSNIIVEGKMNSGSEMIYALKGYFATETAVPEMILFQPWNDVIRANWPDKKLKLGFYRPVISTESATTPADRLANQK
ncbi:MAG TPA: hypothetical protein VK152_06645 [Paludibacter sp.]|nr:hypothetical protein [Paludibacter sp.]